MKATIDPSALIQKSFEVLLLISAYGGIRRNSAPEIDQGRLTATATNEATLKYSAPHSPSVYGFPEGPTWLTVGSHG